MRWKAFIRSFDTAHKLRSFVQQQSRCIKISHNDQRILVLCNSQVEVIVMLAGIDLLEAIEDFFVDPFLCPLNTSAQLR